MKRPDCQRNQQSIEDQWDGTDIEPEFPAKYRESRYLPNISNPDNEYIESYREGDKFS
jgi:hypothetical protein